MYPVSTAYKEKIKELDRTFEAKIQIQHSLGVLNLTDADIVGGSLIYNESSQAGEDFTVGGVVASDLTVTILNKPEYADYDFVGATVTANIGLEVGTGFEYVPLGVFNIDEVGKQRNTIKIKAIDNMIKLDKPYSLSSLGYPATLLQICIDACNVCDVMPAMGSFTNSNYIVQERPDGDLTFRDIIGYIAELSGSFARMNRAGALEFAWYAPSGLTLTGANRFSFTPRDDLVQIKGVMATVDGATYLAGTDEYAVDLSENPLLQGDYETILPIVYNKIKDTAFYPFESSWQGNPAMQAGDVITQIDRDGKAWATLVTSSTYKYRGASTLVAKGLPIIAKGFKGSTNRKIAEIKRRIEKDVGDKLTTLEQAQLHNTELIANMLGGYVIDEEGALYIADNPDLNLAVKVWKWGPGGFGYSSTGKDGPYTTSITADGSIVAMLVAANIITADMVQTGELRSVDGSTRINLDDGTFNFKEALKWENGTLRITSPRITSPDVEISAEVGVRATHKYGEYTQLDGSGLTHFIPEPIYTETPTGVPNTEGFEAGVIPLYFSGSGISISSVARTGTKSLMVNSNRVYRHWRADFKVTKDGATVSFWYRRTGTDVLSYAVALDGVRRGNIVDTGTWTQFVIPDVPRGRHELCCYCLGAGGGSDYLYFDDFVFESNPVVRSISGYSPAVGHKHVYGVHIGSASTGTFWTGSSEVPQPWIQLPEFLRDKEFTVFLSLKDFTYGEGIDEVRLEVIDIDKTIPAFRVLGYAAHTGSTYPDLDHYFPVGFTYLVIVTE